MSKKTRLNLQIPTEVRELLNELTEKSGASSITEVIRRALAYYEVLVEHTKDGGKVILKKGDKEETIRFL